MNNDASLTTITGHNAEERTLFERMLMPGYAYPCIMIMIKWLLAS